MKKYDGLIFKRKKGDAIIDSIMVMVVIFVFAIIAILGYQFFGDLNTDMQSNPDLINQSKDMTGDIYSRYPSVVDGLFLLLVFLMWGFVVVASFVVDTHPVFSAFVFLLIIPIGIVAAMFGNFFQEFFLDPSISGAASAFPIITFVLNHFLETILGMGLTVVLVLYGKSKL